MQSIRWASRLMRRCNATTCGSPWAASPPSCRARTRRRRNGTPRRSARAKETSPRSSSGALKERYAPARARAFRSGQMVSGRTAAALVAELLLAQRRRADLERSALSLPMRRDAIPRQPQTHRGCLRAVAQRLGVSADHVFPAYEDVFYYLLARAQAAGQCRCAAFAKLADPLERARLTRVFGGELASRSAMSCRLPAGSTAPPGKAAVVLARRAMLSDSRRFADRLSPAARFAALGRARRLIRTSIRRIPTQDFARACAAREIARGVTRCRGGSVPTAAAAAARPQRRRAADRRSNLACAHEAAQRRALRFHAADAHAR